MISDCAYKTLFIDVFNKQKGALMHRSKIYKIIIAVLLGLVMTKIVMAESSKEYALMAKATWSKFECSVFA